MAGGDDRAVDGAFKVEPRVLYVATRTVMTIVRPVGLICMAAASAAPVTSRCIVYLGFRSPAIAKTGYRYLASY